MSTIQLRTAIPGPKSKALAERRAKASPAGFPTARRSMLPRPRAPGSKMLTVTATLISREASAASMLGIGVTRLSMR